MKNTKIEYLYRDGSNYKRWNVAVISGTLSETQKKDILSSLEDGYLFIPEQVGLPCDRLDEYDRNEDDTCFCELYEHGFAETDESPDEGLEELTVDELHKRFVEAKGNWDVIKYDPFFGF